MDIVGVDLAAEPRRAHLTGESDGPDGTIRGFYLVGRTAPDLRPIVALADRRSMRRPCRRMAQDRLQHVGDRARRAAPTSSTSTAGSRQPASTSERSPYTDLTPIFSPDGTRLMVERYDVDRLPSDGHAGATVRANPCRMGVAASGQ